MNRDPIMSDLTFRKGFWSAYVIDGVHPLTGEGDRLLVHPNGTATLEGWYFDKAHDEVRCTTTKYDTVYEAMTALAKNPAA